jgi:hypothetical protein
MYFNFDKIIGNQEIPGSNPGQNLLGSVGPIGKALDYERTSYCINFNCYVCYYFPFANIFLRSSLICLT